MEINRAKKTSVGRQRIEIKKIEKSGRLQVTCSKRKKGLFNKAGELCILCGAQAAVIIRSPGGKIFAFGIPSVDSVASLFLGSGNLGYDRGRDYDDDDCGEVVEEEIVEYRKAVGKLETAKDRRDRSAARGSQKAVGVSTEAAAPEEAFWWTEGVDDFGLSELEKHAEALEALMGNVVSKVKDMEAMEAEAMILSDYGGGYQQCFQY